MPEDIPQPVTPQPTYPVATPVNPYFASPAQPVSPTRPTPTPYPSGVPQQTTNPGPEIVVVKNRARFRLPKSKALIAGLVVLVVLIGGGSWYFLAGPGSESALARQFRENSPYVYKKALVDVDPTYRFSFKHSIKPADGADRYAPYEAYEYMSVYSDASLSNRAAGNVFITDKEISIAPPVDRIDAKDPVADESVRISVAGEWGLHSQYYIVQYVDLKTGEKLEKPIVTPFSTKQQVETPVVTFRADDKGNAHFSWTAIEGADRYYVVKLDLTERTSSTILGQTDGTEWTNELDATMLDKQSGVQNILFKDGRFTDDDLLDADNLKQAREIAIRDGEPLYKAEYGVIAVVGDAYSSLGQVSDINQMKAQLPLEIALATLRSMGISSKPEDIDAVPTHLPMTMIDNTTVLRSVILDTEKAAPGDGGLHIPYTVEGSHKEGVFIVRNYDPSSIGVEVSRIAQRNLDARAQSAAIARSVIQERPVIDSQVTASTKRPSVPYKVYATNPLTDYIAANMLMGEKYIDVSAFVSPSNPVTVRDAVDEAVAQNPLILFGAGDEYYYHEDRKLLQIDYADVNLPDQESRVAFQKKLADEARRITNLIIKAGASDEQKVRAINDYIVSTAQYDLDAVTLGQSLDYVDPQYEYAWLPSGVLFEKKAVCVGYASVFKLLADFAGLDSVYVNGTTNGTGHAWNKVKVNGIWKLIDTTWNDPIGGEPNDNYYLITDKQAQEKRVQVEGDAWIAGAQMSNYATK